MNSATDKTPASTTPIFGAREQAGTKMVNLQAVDLAELLADRLENSSGKKKRARTRIAILAATAAEIRDNGYENLTVDGITGRAGMARGTFYIYFQNRVEAASAVHRLYWALIRKIRPRGRGRLTVRQNIDRMNRFFLDQVGKNAALLVGRENLFHEAPDLARTLSRMNEQWARLVLADIRQKAPDRLVAEEEDLVLLKIRAVISMSDSLLRDHYRALALGAVSLFGNREHIVRAMGDIWYQVLYGTPVLPEDGSGTPHHRRMED